MADDESPTPEEAARNFEEHERWNAAALLAVERAALNRLQPVIETATDGLVAAASRTDGSVIDRQRAVRSTLRIAVPRLTLALNDAVLGIRAQAREAGQAVLVREVRADVGDAHADIEDDPDLLDLTADSAPAHISSTALASVWGTIALRALGKWVIEPRRSLIAALDKTTKLLVPRVSLTATTEMAYAYNEQRGLRTQAVSDRMRQSGDSPAQRRGLTKFWSAILDGRVCPRCFEMQGQAVPVGEPFDVPGYGALAEPPLHPHCRCSAPVLALGFTPANDVSAILRKG